MTFSPTAVSFTPPATALTRPMLKGSFGMTASTHWLATASAQAVLERGGNAFDAAVAGGFVLHIVEPHLNGPGGDMVALIAPAGNKPLVLMGQGPAPRRATISHFRAEGLASVPGAGALAAAVPGAVEAWLALLQDHGTWELADVLEYALHYAEQGHQLGAQAASVIATMAQHFSDHWPSSAAQWMPDGRAPLEGESITNAPYAAVLRRLIQASRKGGSREARIQLAREEWKSGFVAEAAVTFTRIPHRHSTGKDHGGVLDTADFKNFHASYEEPLSLEFRGSTILKAGFWSQGPVLLQTLAVLDHFHDEELDPSSARGAHTILEALKLAMADRDAYYGDSHPSGLLHQLLEPTYSKSRAAEIDDQASVQFRPGTIQGVRAYIPPLTDASEDNAALGAGEPTVRISGETRGDTCHLDVVDRLGNMVSATPSGGWLQSSPTIPALGFALGTRLQMTWLDPDAPSALRPGTRPRTTLSPTLIMKDGATVSALGTPGGDQQDQWQLLYLLRTIVGGYNPQQAIDAPMFHTSALAGSFWPREFHPAGVVMEDRIDPAVVAELRDRGHEVSVVDGWSLGRLSTVSRDPATGMLGAAANARGNQGYAGGR